LNLNLLKKVYIVSGSSRGIGRGIAKTLLDEGACVVLTGRDIQSLQSTYDALICIYPDQVIQHAGDLGKEQTLEALAQSTLKKWNKIDGIIANAGAVKPVDEWNILETDWKWYVTANLLNSIRFTTHFIPHLKKTKGSIVFISSIAGLEDIGAPVPYSTSKAALTMYAKGLARKLSQDGIRVNTVAPGNIIFSEGNWEMKLNDDPIGTNKMLIEKVPLRRFGKPEDIGNIVTFLVSEKANFITGSCFVVDGGQTRLFI